MSHPTQGNSLRDALNRLMSRPSRPPGRRSKRTRAAAAVSVEAAEPRVMLAGSLVFDGAAAGTKVRLQGDPNPAATPFLPGESVVIDSVTAASSPAYSWRQVSGPAVTPQFGTTGARLDFVVPATVGPATLAFDVEVTSGGQTTTARATVALSGSVPQAAPKVSSVRSPPAGQTASHTLTLPLPQSSAGAPEYSWRQTGGPDVGDLTHAASGRQVSFNVPSTAAPTTLLLEGVISDDASTAVRRYVVSVEPRTETSGRPATLLPEVLAAGTTETVVGDFDGDGFEDIAAFDVDASIWTVGLQRAGSLVQADWGQWTPAEGTYTHLAAVDINGDGRDDVLALGGQRGDWEALMSEGDRFTPSAMTVGVPAVPNVPSPSWPRRNPDTDEWTFDWTAVPGVQNYQYLFEDRSSAGTVQWTSGTSVAVDNAFAAGVFRFMVRGRFADGSFTPWSEAVEVSSAHFGRTTPWSEVVTADFSGDGREDVLLASSLTGELDLMSSDGVRWSRSRWADVPANTDLGDARPADIDGDGLPDLVAKRGGGWTVLMNGGAGGHAVAATGLPTNWQAWRIGDFDGDGRDDLIGRPAGGQWKMYVFDGSQFVHPTGGWSFSTPAGWSADDAEVRDLNGDGRDDFLDWSVQTSRVLTASSTGFAPGVLSAADGSKWFGELTSAGASVLDAGWRGEAFEAAYLSVRNEIEFDAYFGVKKGAVGTERSGSGSAWDQATLLAARLEGAGVDWRYASGRVSASGDDLSRLQRLLGVLTPQAAVSALDVAGLAPTASGLAGPSAAVDFEHAWLQVRLPGASGMEWTDVDPSWSDMSGVRAEAVSAVSFDTAAAFSASLDDESPLAKLAGVTSPQHGPATTYAVDFENAELSSRMPEGLRVLSGSASVRQSGEPALGKYLLADEASLLAIDVEGLVDATVELHVRKLQPGLGLHVRAGESSRSGLLTSFDLSSGNAEYVLENREYGYKGVTKPVGSFFTDVYETDEAVDPEAARKAVLEVTADGRELSGGWRRELPGGGWEDLTTAAERLTIGDTGSSATGSVWLQLPAGTLVEKIVVTGVRVAAHEDPFEAYLDAAGPGIVIAPAQTQLRERGAAAFGRPSTALLRRSGTQWLESEKHRVRVSLVDGNGVAYSPNSGAIAAMYDVADAADRPLSATTAHRADTSAFKWYSDVTLRPFGGAAEVAYEIEWVGAGQVPDIKLLVETFDARAGGASAAADRSRLFDMPKSRHYSLSLDAGHDSPASVADMLDRLDARVSVIDELTRSGTPIDPENDRYTTDDEAILQTLAAVGASYRVRSDRSLDRLARATGATHVRPHVVAGMVSSRRTAATGAGGSFYVAPDGLTVDFPGQTFAPVGVESTSASFDTADQKARVHLAALELSSLESDVVSGVTRGDSISAVTGLNYAAARPQTVYRLEKSGGTYLDLLTGATVSDPAAALDLGSAEAEVLSLIESGHRVLVHSSPIPSNDSWDGVVYVAEKTSGGGLPVIQSIVVGEEGSRWNGGVALPASPVEQSAAEDGLLADTHSGLMARVDTDVVVPNAGPDVRFTRTYSTRDVEGLDIGLGVGWTYSFSDSLVVDLESSRTAEWRNDRGQITVFSLAESGGAETFVPPVSQPRHKLEKVSGSDDYRLTLPDGTEYRFREPAAGEAPAGENEFRLVGVRDRHANEVTVTYESVPGGVRRRVLRSAENGVPAATLLTMEFDEVGTEGLLRLTAVTDLEGRAWSYGYPAGEPEGGLARVDGPADASSSATFWEYAYVTEAGLLAEANALYGTSATEASGADAVVGLLSSVSRGGVGDVRYEYFRDGKLRSSENGDGSRTRYRYDEFKRATTVVDPRGRETEYRHLESGLVSRVIDEGGGFVRSEWDAFRGLLESTTDSNGDTTTMTYYGPQHASAGKLLQRINSDGSGVLMTYEPDYGQEATTTVDPTPAAPGSGDERTTVRTYAASPTRGQRGNPVAVTDPEGRVTEFDYFNTGLARLERRPRKDAGESLADRTTYFAYTHGGVLQQTRRRWDGQDAIEWTRTDAAGRRTFDNVTYGGTVVGGTTSYATDLYGRVLATEAPDPTGAGGVPAADRTVTQTYRPDGQVESVTTPEGLTTRYRYDGAGRRTHEIAPDGTFTRREYNADGTLAAVTDPLGRTTRYVYDDRRRVSQVIDPLGGVELFEYDREGRLGLHVSPGGIERRFEYDAAGRLDKEIFSDGTTHDVDHDAFGNLVREVDRRGLLTTYEYDAADQLTRQSVGTVVSGTDTFDRVDTFAYDGAGRLVETSSYDVTGLPDRTDIGQADLDGLDGTAAHRLATTEYDNFGRPVKVVDAAGGVTKYRYDALGRVVEQLSPLGLRTETAYDDVGQVLSTTTTSAVAEGEAAVASREYDNLGRVVSETSPTGSVAFFAYDAFGRRTASADAAGAVSRTAYDAAGRAVLEVGPLGGVARTAYDALDRAAASYGPDPDGAGGGGPARVVREYDADGRLLTETDPLGHVTEFAYDAEGRLIRTTSPDPDGDGSLGRPVVIRAYDASTGDLLRETAAAVDVQGTVRAGSERVTEYTYDAFGRVRTVTHPDPGDGKPRIVVTRSYDGFGNLVSESPNHGPEVVYTYDAAGRLLTRTSEDPDGSTPAPYAPNNPRITTEYAYDAAGNVVSETVRPSDDNTGVGFAPLVTSHGYDAQGRRIWTASPDPDPTQSGDGFDAMTDAMVYDLAGRVSAELAPTGAEISHHYDDLGRKVRTVLPDPDDAGPLKSPETAYRHDLLGRVAESVGPRGGVTRTVYDLAGRVTQVISPDPDGTGLLTSPSVKTFYDAAGRVEREESGYLNAAGQFVRFAAVGFVRDALGRVKVQLGTDPDTGLPSARFQTVNTYDDRGDLVAVTDARGNTTRVEYDGLGRERKVILPHPTSSTLDGPTTETFYDARGNVQKTIDALDGQTTFVYDFLDRLVESRGADPDTGNASGAYKTTFDYDPLGRQSSVTRNLGSAAFERDKDSVFDRLGRKTQEDGPVWMAPATPGGPDVEHRFRTKWVYDGAGRVVEELRVTVRAAGIGNWIELDGSDGRPDTRRQTTTDHDRLGRVVAVHAPDKDTGLASASPTTEFAYDAAGNVLRSRDERGYWTDFVYDALGRVIEQEAPDPVTGDGVGRPKTLTAYGVDGFIASSTDMYGRVTTFEYDRQGRLIKEQLPDPDATGPLPAPFTETEYDAAGNATLVRDHLGRTWESFYDNLNRVFQERSPHPVTGQASVDYRTVTAYDDAGNVTLVGTTFTQANGTPGLSRTQSAYDKRGRLVSVRMPDPVTGAPSHLFETTYDYNRFDQLTLEVDPEGVESRAVYDNLGRTVQSLGYDPDGSGPAAKPRRRTTYDLEGHVALVEVSLAAADGSGAGTWRATSFEYDKRGRETASVVHNSAGDERTERIYTADGLLQRLTDPNGNQTVFRYDALGRIFEREDQHGVVKTEYETSAGGYLDRTLTTDRNGEKVRRFHDPLGRVISESWVGGPDGGVAATYVYDAAGRLASATTRDSTDAYTYDHRDRVSTHTQTAGSVTVLAVSYSYGVADEVTEAVYDGTDKDWLARYAVDAQGRTTEILQQGTGAVLQKTVEYDYVRTRLASVQRYRGKKANFTSATPGYSTSSRTAYAYDDSSRLDGIAHYRGASLLHELGYAFNAAGDVGLTTSSIDGTIDYGRDSAGQLTSADYAGSRADESFAYDDSGNRTGAGYDADPAGNRLEEDPNYTYTFDAEGRRTTRTAKDASGQATGEHLVYDWNRDGTLDSVTVYDRPGPGRSALRDVEYGYNAAGEVVSRHFDSDGDGSVDQIRRYAYDGEDVVAVTSSAGGVLTVYLHGPSTDDVQAADYFYTNGQGNTVAVADWLLSDRLGTVTDSSRSGGSQTATQHIRYDAFGSPLETPAAAWGGKTGVTNTGLFYGFAGRWLDPDADLANYRARWYDPQAGRFASEDPAGFAAGDANLYRYGGNAPLSGTDPSGMIFDKIGDFFEDVWEGVTDFFDDVGDIFEDIGDWIRHDFTDFLQDAGDLVGDVAQGVAGFALSYGLPVIAAVGGPVGWAVSAAFGGVQLGPISVGWDSPLRDWAEKQRHRGFSGLGIEDEWQDFASSRGGALALSAASAAAVGSFQGTALASGVSAAAITGGGLVAQNNGFGQTYGYAFGGIPVGGNGLSIGGLPQLAARAYSGIRERRAAQAHAAAAAPAGYSASAEPTVFELGPVSTDGQKRTGGGAAGVHAPVPASHVSGYSISSEPPRLGLVNDAKPILGLFYDPSVQQAGRRYEVVDGHRIKQQWPSSSRGAWVSGSEGNGVFRYNDDQGPLAGKEVEFKDYYIAEGGFPKDAYYGGSPADASVNIGTVTGDDYADFKAADEAMRRKPGNADWKRPKNYTWNHAGKPGSTRMELVKMPVHGAVSHTGNAVVMRKKLKAMRVSMKALGVADAYLTLKDAAIESGIWPQTYEVAKTQTYYYRQDDSIYTVVPGRWWSRPYKKYVAGPREGRTIYMSAKQVQQHKAAAEQKWGRYVPGTWFREPKFIPGTHRDRLPLETFDRDGGLISEGYIDEDGPHPGIRHDPLY